MANDNKSVTRVVYDCSQAKAEITALARETEKASDQSQDAFDKMAKGASKLGDGYGSAASSALKLGKAAVSFGPAGVALAAAAAAAAGLVANLVDAPALLRSTAEQARSFANALADAAKLRESLFKFNDSGDELEFSKRAIALKGQANELNLRRQDTRENQSAVSEKLGQWREYYSSLGAMARETQSSLQSGEKRLADLSDARLAKDKEATEIAREAVKLAKAGQFDRAQSLIGAAGAKAGNEYERRDVDDAQRQYEAAVKRSVSADQTRLKQLGALGEAGAAQIKSLNAEADALRKRALAEQGEGVGLKNDRRTLQIDMAKDNAADEGTLARGRLADAMAKLNEAANRERTTLEKGKDLFSALGTAVTGGATNYTEGLKKITAAQAEFRNIKGLIDAGKISEATQPINRFMNLVKELQKQEDILPGSQKFNFDALVDGAKALGEVLDANADIKANDKSLQEIGTITEPLSASEISSKGIFTNLAAAASAAGRLKEALASIPAIPSAGAQAANAAGPTDAVAVAAVGASAVNQTLTVNVQGGMVDQATINQLTAAIQRQARLGLG